MTDGFDDRPPYAAVALAVLAAVVATGLAAGGGAAAAGIAALGVPLVGFGAVRAVRGLVTAGAVLLAFGGLVAGGFGAPPPLTLGSVAAAVVSWDAAEHGIGLGEHVGRDARTTHAVVAHIAATTLVAVVASVVVALLYTVGPGGRPVTALLLLLVGVLVLAVALTD